MLNKMIWKA